MRNILGFVFIFLFIGACNNDSKNESAQTSDTINSTTTNATTVITGTGEAWSAQYRETFLQQCVTGATNTMGAEKATSYCTCMLDKMQQTYPDTTTLNNMTLNEMQKQMTEMAKGCIN